MSQSSAFAFAGNGDSEVLFVPLLQCLCRVYTTQPMERKRNIGVVGNYSHHHHAVVVCHEALSQKHNNNSSKQQDVAAYLYSTGRRAAAPATWFHRNYSGALLVSLSQRRGLCMWLLLLRVVVALLQSCARKLRDNSSLRVVKVQGCTVSDLFLVSHGRRKQPTMTKRTT